MTAAAAITESQADFAKRLGKHRAYVTRLKQEGRLVMEGGKVVVEPTLAKLKATESPLPHHEAIRERHAEGGGVTAPIDLASVGLAHKMAVARRAAADAEMAEMERDKLAGTLVEAAQVAAGALEAGAGLRELMDSLPDRLSGELSAIDDPVVIAAHLTEAFEHVQAEFDRMLGAMSRQGLIDDAPK